jgi:hypothetical protein
MPYKTILERDGFSGISSCSKDFFQTENIGSIAVAGNTYTIIDYRYRSAPGPGGSVHGGQRILVIEDGQKYLGQYALSTPPFYRISVGGVAVHLDSPEDGASTINFEKGGPPLEAQLPEGPVELSKIAGRTHVGSATIDGFRYALPILRVGIWFPHQSS